MTLSHYMIMSKPALIRKITKALRAMPKAKLARLCYNITKSKLPRLKKSRLDEYETFRKKSMRKEVNIGATGTQKYRIKVGPNKGKVLL